MTVTEQVLDVTEINPESRFQQERRALLGVAGELGQWGEGSEDDQAVVRQILVGELSTLQRHEYSYSGLSCLQLPSFCTGRDVKKRVLAVATSAATDHVVNRVLDGSSIGVTQTASSLIGYAEALSHCGVTKSRTGALSEVIEALEKAKLHRMCDDEVNYTNGVLPHLKAKRAEWLIKSGVKVGILTSVVATGLKLGTRHV